MPLTSTFSTISASQTDANSPLDEVLMDAIRQDIDVLYEWMGGPTYTPSTSHDHDGVNSKNISGASLAFLGSTTVSAVANVAVTSLITTAYDDYIWIAENLLITNDNDSMILTVSTDNGANYSASNYWNGNPNAALAGPNANVTISNLNNHVTLPIVFTLKLYNPNANSYAKQMEWKGSYPLTGTGVQNSFDKHLMWNETGAGKSVNAFKINISSGLSGTFKFYGIKKT